MSAAPEIAQLPPGPGVRSAWFEPEHLECLEASGDAYGDPYEAHLFRWIGGEVSARFDFARESWRYNERETIVETGREPTAAERAKLDDYLEDYADTLTGWYEAAVQP